MSAIDPARPVYPKNKNGDVDLKTIEPDGSSTPALSVYFFASTRNYEAQGYYDFVLDASVFADQQGFTAAWFPERHFVSFGGFSPNPAVLASAVAARTQRLHLRAGSVAAPLHHAVRIAEEWAMVDGLSKGRVGLSLASGWHQTDFVLAAEPHAQRKDVTNRRLEQLRDLWAGQSVEFNDPDGNRHAVQLSPTPVSKVLPLWMTTAGNPETYELAGRLGVGVMCALFNQTLRQLARKIERYRAAWREAGHAGRGHVVTMVHTCVSEDENLHELLRPVMREYLLSYSSQVGANASDDVLDAAVESYFDGPSLLGSPERVQQVLLELEHADIDEIGALIDFGLPYEVVLKNLPNLARVYAEVKQLKRGNQ